MYLSRKLLTREKSVLEFDNFCILWPVIVVCFDDLSSTAQCVFGLKITFEYSTSKVLHQQRSWCSFEKLPLSSWSKRKSWKASSRKGVSSVNSDWRKKVGRLIRKTRRMFCFPEKGAFGKLRPDWIVSPSPPCQMHFSPIPSAIQHTPIGLLTPSYHLPTYLTTERMTDLLIRKLPPDWPTCAQCPQ